LIITPESVFVNIDEQMQRVLEIPSFNQGRKKYERSLSIAKEQVEGGAQIIEISMDERMLDGRYAMTKFLNLIAAEPDISRVPIMLIVQNGRLSNRFESGARQRCRNSISLKEGEAQFIHRAS
jgi:5-methyltetrahydrofolate--homocysteine methyltransferase